MNPFQTENGAYRLFYRQGGSVTEDAVACFRAAADTGADFLYADEAVLVKDGGSVNLYKPTYSPETLLSLPYIGSPFAVAERLLGALAPPEDDSGEALADFVLRAEERAAFIRHVPAVLFSGTPKEPFGYERLVQRALNRRGIQAEAVQGAFFGSCCVRYGLPKRSTVAVIVPYEGDADAVRTSLDAAAAGTGENLTYYVPYAQTPDARAARYLNALKETGAAKILYLPGCTSPQTLKNEAARHASEELLLFLDAGTAAISHDAVERMAEYALLPHIAAVGAKIISPEGLLLHTGLVPGLGAVPGTLFYGSSEKKRSALSDRYVNCIRNVSAVGGGALMVAREHFLAGRSFDETVPAYAADAEFCIRLGRAGWRSIYQPYARFCRRAENAPVPDKAEKERLTDIFFRFMEEGDPMLSQNVKLMQNHWIRP